jgi:UPF0716 family protein affecting phage T7 exclusion
LDCRLTETKSEKLGFILLLPSIKSVAAVAFQWQMNSEQKKERHGAGFTKGLEQQGTPTTVKGDADESTQLAPPHHPCDATGRGVISNPFYASRAC